jgi:hypothetical protein
MGRKVWFPAVSGPLAPHAARFAAWLASRSYSPSAAANRLSQLDQLPQTHLGVQSESRMHIGMR